MSEKSDGAQTIKISVLSIIVTAISSIAVAFIGIMPQLREKDQNQIDALRREVISLTQAESGRGTGEAGEKCNINGSLETIDGVPLANAEVYLIVASGSENMATTGDAGHFSFQGVKDVPYWIVVRHCPSKKVPEHLSVQILLPGLLRFLDW